MKRSHHKVLKAGHRSVVELPRGRSSRKVIAELGNTMTESTFVDDFDLNDESFGAEISVEKLSLLTRDDIYSGLQQALPPGLRKA